ncbi:MAG TPA: DMT family transporter [Micromonosporaceae bacterium]
MLFAVGFAVLAAFLFATSASLQQIAAHREDYTSEAADGRGRTRDRWVVVRALVHLFRHLVRNPLWIVGWFTNLIGFGIQALALHFGSVALVQPLLVTQLLFALPMGSATRRRWPHVRDWIAAGLICGGLAVFLAVRGIAPIDDEASRERLILVGFAAIGAVAALVLASTGRRPLVHATLVSIAAGLCFAMSAAMIKLTSDDLINRGVAATARDWPGYALAVSTLCGLLLEQGAFAAGSLPSAVAAMTITNPIASYVIGVFAFGVALPVEVGQLAALAGAGALVCLGAVGLAHSPIVRPAPPVEAARISGQTHSTRDLPGTI